MATYTSHCHFSIQDKENLPGFLSALVVEDQDKYQNHLYHTLNHTFWVIPKILSWGQISFLIHLVQQRSRVLFCFNADGFIVALNLHVLSLTDVWNVVLSWKMHRGTHRGTQKKLSAKDHPWGWMHITKNYCINFAIMPTSIPYPCIYLMNLDSTCTLVDAGKHHDPWMSRNILSEELDCGLAGVGRIVDQGSQGGIRGKEQKENKQSAWESKWHHEYTNSCLHQLTNSTNQGNGLQMYCKDNLDWGACLVSTPHAHQPLPLLKMLLAILQFSLFLDGGLIPSLIPSRIPWIPFTKLVGT